MIDLSKFALPLRIVEFVFGLLVLALLAAVANYLDENASKLVDEPAFLLFCVCLFIIILPLLLTFINYF